MVPYRVQWIGIASAVVVAAIGVGVVLAPQLLVPRSPTEPGTTQGPNAGTTGGPIGAPVWAVGDTWTYNVTLTASECDRNDTLVDGQITDAVVGVLPDQGSGQAYNVTVNGTFALHIAGSHDDGAHDEAVSPLHHGMPFSFTQATLTGYSWYRTTDLARLADVRTIRLDGAAAVMSERHNGSGSAHLTVTLRATYDPPWDHWAFPLGENETWNVTTTATVEGQSVFRADFPDGWVEIGRNFSFAVELNYTVASAGFENVETPAGVFSALRTTAMRHVREHNETDDDNETKDENETGGDDNETKDAMDDHMDTAAADVDGNMALALNLATEGRAHRAAVVWFSADVGNVVHATAMLRGSVRLEILLVSFSHGA